MFGLLDETLIASGSIVKCYHWEKACKYACNYNYMTESRHHGWDFLSASSLQTTQLYCYVVMQKTIKQNQI